MTNRGCRPTVRLIACAAAIGATALTTSCSTSLASAAPSHKTQQVTIVGNAHMQFKPDSLTVKPGTVQITLEVKGAETHNIDFPSLHVVSPVIHRHQTTTVTIHGAANHSYSFVCDLHSDMGMVGVLHVTH